MALAGTETAMGAMARPSCAESISLADRGRATKHENRMNFAVPASGGKGELPIFRRLRVNYLYRARIRSPKHGRCLLW